MCYKEYKEETKPGERNLLIDHVKSFAVTHGKKWSTIYKSITSNRTQLDSLYP
jgi:hypothetical protein